MPQAIPSMPGYGLGQPDDDKSSPASSGQPMGAGAAPDADDQGAYNGEAGEAKQAMGDSLGGTLDKRWFAWASVRQPIEDEWLKDLRSYCGLYEPSVLAEIGPERTKLFVNITRVKVQAAYARLVDLYTQSKDEPWGIEPTPEPELCDAEMAAIHNELNAANIALTEDNIKAASAAYASDTAEKMHDRIADQLDEADWMTHLKSALKEMCIIGNGALNGAVIKNKITTSWARAKDARANDGWDLEEISEIVPGMGWTSVWDLYPDPYATSMATADGCFERMVLNQEQLNRLAALPDFNADIIADTITAAPMGNHVDLWHEVERRYLAGFTTTTMGNNRYDVLVYWGNVSGLELQTAGATVTETSKTYQANVWVLNGRCIRVKINPLNPKRIPYQMAPYEQIPGFLWGIGPPRQMRDSQVMLNAISRAMVDNAALTSGPQVEVNDDLAAEGSNTDTIKPWKIWHRTGGDPQYAMLRFYNIQSAVAELTELQASFRQYCDEETSLPSYTHGEEMPGLNKTASGMSMLMSAANVVIKTVVKNVDDYLISPLITSFYDWNMEYSDDPTIKGDMSIIARGSTALIAKEIQAQRIQALLALVMESPQGAAIADVAYLYRSLADSMDLDGKKAFPQEKVDAYELSNRPGGPDPNGAPGVPGGPGIPPGAPAQGPADGAGPAALPPPGAQPGAGQPAQAPGPG